MNGIHDMGGMHGFGPVVAEPDEPVFHAEWERRVFAMRLAMGSWRRWNLDMSRYTVEQMPPAEYLAASYYERWLFSLLLLLEQSGLLNPDELQRVRERPESVPQPMQSLELQGEVLKRDQVERTLRTRRGARMEDPVLPRFRAGQPVVARKINPIGHTRIPRYVRGRRGVVDRDHGVFIFPDAHAAGRGKEPQHVYSVRFDARELWGPQGGAREAIYVDLWDDYLEPFEEVRA